MSDFVENPELPGILGQFYSPIKNTHPLDRLYYIEWLAKGDLGRILEEAGLTPEEVNDGFDPEYDEWPEGPKDPDR